MDHNRLGRSGLRVPALAFGTATFGGGNDFFKAWGATDAQGATRLVDVCLEHGVTLFDTADVYSQGLAERILGEAIRGRRNRLLVSTKVTFPMGGGPNDFGSSRQHLLEAVDASLARLGVDHVDLLQLHGQDANTPVEETLSTLDGLVRAGKVRYVGCSNFSGWHLMKSLASSERHGWPRYVAHQAYYSLLEPRLRVGAAAARPRSGRGRRGLEPARLGQAHRQDPPRPAGRARLARARHRRHAAPLRRGAAVPHRRRAGRGGGGDGQTVPQVALNWLLRRPTVQPVIIGARNEEQLVQNIGAVGWQLTPEQVATLDAASDVPPAYPVWHQRGFPMLNERGW